MSEIRTSYLIARADRALRAQLEGLLAQGGLALNEVTVLSVLAERPGLSNAGLARRSLVSPQAMHKVMRSLEVAGLVTRTTSPSGGRALETTLTSAGRSRLAEADARLGEAEDAFLGHLEPEERSQLRTLLLRVTGLDRSPARDAEPETGSAQDRG